MTPFFAFNRYNRAGIVNLLHENIINEDEYNILIKKYYDKEKKELNKIGFKEL